jgi:hypothetical protein
MATKTSWHSTKGGVYHNNPDCHLGKDIDKENRRDGTGGKKICKECQRLNAKKK